MIRMIQSSSAKQAKDYFRDALNPSDYYTNDQELQGRFYGRLAQRLGLEALVTKDQFYALCENRNLVTGKSLTPHTKEGRRVGYDVNFHAPKSLSVLHSLSKDDHLLHIFQDSVRDTMKEIEADSKTRVRKDGAQEDRQTGELVWAEFTHFTARPVDGHLPDPHIHIHSFIFNATWDEDEIEQKFKAGQFGDIKRDMNYYQSRFHKRMADKLIEAGYQIRRTKSSFEIVGVPQRVIDLFSKRTNEIGRIAKEKGITGAKELDGLGARTRSKKQKGLSMAELKQGWKDQIAALGKDGKEDSTPIRFAPVRERHDLTPQQCVNHSLHHSFERASVMTKRKLLTEAYRHSIGAPVISLDSITNAFENDSRIIQVQERSQMVCTTIDVLKEEQHMVELARRGRGVMSPIYRNLPDIKLDGQQANAIRHVLTTKNRVSIIRGAAGAGKTTLMQEAVELIENTGVNVITVAPTAQASRGVLRKEGFKDADTVASLLADEKLQNKLRGQVLWVDEAGLLGTKDMTRLLKLVEECDARLILGGDTRQHAAVIRGDALRIINTVGGIASAEVNEIRRQKNAEYKAAVKDLSNGAVKDGFHKLDAIGSIKTFDPLSPNSRLVDDYIHAIKRRKSALIISPTHEQGASVTASIRERLKQEGLIGKNDLIARRLTNTNLTEAQKQDWRNYTKGQTIRFNQNVRGAKRGSHWVIESAENQRVILRHPTGKTLYLPQSKAQSYEVFQPSDIALAKGDKIHITLNSFDLDKKRMDNGQALTVLRVNKSGKIILQGDKGKVTYTLDKDFGHLTHAHCVTSYASQGKTVDEVFISQPAGTFGATDAKQFYVSVSRAKEMCHVYTDDRDELLRHASDMGDRQSAMELVGKKDLHIDHVLQHQRNDHPAPVPSIEPIKTPYPSKPKIDLDYEL